MEHAGLRLIDAVRNWLATPACRCPTTATATRKTATAAASWPIWTPPTAEHRQALKPAPGGGLPEGPGLTGDRARFGLGYTAG